MCVLFWLPILQAIYSLLSMFPFFPLSFLSVLRFSFPDLLWWCTLSPVIYAPYSSPDTHCTIVSHSLLVLQFNRRGARELVTHVPLLIPVPTFSGKISSTCLSPHSSFSPPWIFSFCSYQCHASPKLPLPQYLCSSLLLLQQPVGEGRDFHCSVPTREK